MSIPRLLQNAESTIAVVGATDSPGKYGGIIYRDLKAKGFRVFAVNPHRMTVDGDQAYPSLAALPEQPSIVDIVVPADQTLAVLDEAEALGLDNIWVQPGAEDSRVIDRLAASSFEYLVNSCIMVQSHRVA